MAEAKIHYCVTCNKPVNYSNPGLKCESNDCTNLIHESCISDTDSVGQKRKRKLWYCMFHDTKKNIKNIRNMCPLCNIYVDEGIQCNACKKWYHYGCANIPNPQGKKIKTKWLCPMEKVSEFESPFDNNGEDNLVKMDYTKKDTEDDFLGSLDDITDIELRFPCRPCDLYFNDEKHLDIHKRYIHHYCKACNTFMKDNYEFLIHNEFHHTDGIKKGKRSTKHKSKRKSKRKTNTRKSRR